MRKTLGMLQRRKTTTTQTRIEARFNSVFTELPDLFRESLELSTQIKILCIINL